MSILEAIFLGIVQGVTEFLPVSSSGHLAILQQLFGMEEAGISFDVFLHIGTLIAVCVVYWRDLIKIIIEFFGICRDLIRNLSLWIEKKKFHDDVEYVRIIRSSYRKFTVLVIVSTIPTGIIGILLKNLVERASATLIVPGICLLITAVLLFIADSVPDYSKTPKHTTWFDAVVIGIVQGLATLPGISRSGSTIAAGLLRGLKREFAVKYSFIMSIPAILGAMIFEIPDMAADITSTGPVCYLVGMVMAAVVGYFCIKSMLVVVSKKKFKWFSAYCVIIGMVAIVASFII